MSKWKERWKYATELRPEPLQLPPWGYKEPTLKERLEIFFCAIGIFALPIMLIGCLLFLLWSVAKLFTH